MEDENTLHNASPSLITIDTLSCTASDHDLVPQSFLTMNNKEDEDDGVYSTASMLTVDDKEMTTTSKIMLLQQQQQQREFSNNKKKQASITTSAHTHPAPAASSSPLTSSSLLLSLQSGEVKPSKLELPAKSSGTDYWASHLQDPFWAQLRSPWHLNDLIPLTPLPNNLHNF